MSSGQRGDYPFVTAGRWSRAKAINERGRKWVRERKREREQTMIASFLPWHTSLPVRPLLFPPSLFPGRKKARERSPVNCLFACSHLFGEKETITQPVLTWPEAWFPKKYTSTSHFLIWHDKHYCFMWIRHFLLDWDFNKSSCWYSQWEWIFFNRQSD